MPTAYDGIKYLDVFLMASVVFPTYFLARLARLAARGALRGRGAGAIPSLAYTGYLVEENLAYPYAALCFFLIAKALVELRTGGAGRRWGVAALLVAARRAVRPRRARRDPCRRRARARFFAWSSSDGRPGAPAAWSAGRPGSAPSLLVFGAIFLISGFGSKHSYAWLVATRGFKHRMINMGGWAAGSLAIGIGVLPLAAGLAALVRLPGEQPRPGAARVPLGQSSPARSPSASTPRSRPPTSRPRSRRGSRSGT